MKRTARKFPDAKAFIAEVLMQETSPTMYKVLRKDLLHPAQFLLSQSSFMFARKVAGVDS